MKRALLLALIWPVMTGAQTVSGKVTMGNSGLAVRGARLVLIDSAGRPRMAALSDSSGLYSMSVSVGSYRLRVTGPTGSDETVTPFFSVARNHPTSADVALVSTAQLAAVRVRGKRDLDASAIDPHKYDQVVMRRELGAGHFMSRQDIEARNARVTRDLLDGIPGLSVRQEGDSSIIRSTRCSGKTIPGLDAGSLAGGGGKPDSNKQQPMLFVDGHRMSDILALEDIHPGEVEAIEVFQGASELPAEAKGDACFAIYIWLKAGGKPN
jgi:carboxypeptidase family protein/TonB-dependent receptor-like protein